MLGTDGECSSNVLASPLGPKAHVFPFSVFFSGLYQGGKFNIREH